jgi:pyridoxal phosphate enzyme (YggS family)
MRNSEYASSQLHAIQDRIRVAANNAGRESASITLVGAAKQKSADLVAAFGNAGLRDIGENYLGQGLEKQILLPGNTFVWHFIGKIQSNKTQDIASHFSWVHAVDRLKIARRFNDQLNNKPPLQILVQIDIDDEPSKGGIPANLATEFCQQISQFKNLKLRGLMLLPKARSIYDEQRKPFAQARELLEQVNQRYGLAMDTLSMGMSNDLEAAIKEGSTMIRIGTDLFGARTK